MKQFLSGIIIITAALCNAQHPSVGGFNVYYGHLHNHTGATGGKDTALHAYPFARDTSHLDFFGLAEHENMLTKGEWDTVKLAADQYNQDNVFVAFSGFEWTSPYGHVTVFGTEELANSFNYQTDMFAELVEWLGRNNGYAILNHPHGGSVEFDHFRSVPSDRVIGMELWNTNDGFERYYYNNGNDTTDGGKSFYDEANSRGWHIGAAGSEDNHSGTFGKFHFRMGILSNQLTRGALTTALVQRRFFSTEDINIALSFKMNNNEMGAIIDTGKTDIKIEAFDKDGERFKKVQLIRLGTVIHSWDVDTDTVSITYSIVTKCGESYYVKVTEADSNEAISSPIFVKMPDAMNTKPVVTISQPANGKKYYKTDTITVNVTAFDSDGTIEKVEFYVDSLLTYTDTVYPYSYSITKPMVGHYSFTAMAYDNECAAVVSNSVIVKVDNPPKSLNAGIAGMMLIYPNPCSGILNLKFPESATFTVSVVNMQGAELINVRCTDAESAILDLSMIPAGVYAIAVRSSESVSVRKIIKQ